MAQWHDCPKCKGKGIMICSYCQENTKLDWHGLTSAEIDSKLNRDKPCYSCGGSGILMCDYPGCMRGKVMVFK